jgi:hypothetical protein
MPRLAKGSEEARQRMAHLRTMRKKKGGSIPEAPMVPPPKEESPKLETTGKGSKKTSWLGEARGRFRAQEQFELFRGSQRPQSQRRIYQKVKKNLKTTFHIILFFSIKSILNQEK